MLQVKCLNQTQISLKIQISIINKYTKIYWGGTGDGRTNTQHSILERKKKNIYIHTQMQFQAQIVPSDPLIFKTSEKSLHMLQKGKMIQRYQVLQHLGKLKINIVLSYSKGHGMQRFK